MGISKLLLPIRIFREKKKYTKIEFSAFVDALSILEGVNYIGANTNINNCNVGRGSYFNNSCVVSNTNIGRYSCIGREVLCGLGSHPTHRAAIHRMFYAGNFPGWLDYRFESDYKENAITNIGSDVWIGARCVIRDGVSIGDGAVIGANSVITRDVAPYTIVAGAPCRVVANRFNQNIIDRLLEVKWWNYSPESVKSAAKAGQFNKEMKVVEDVETLLFHLENSGYSLEKNTITDNIDGSSGGLSKNRKKY
jgi:acetyltransferase-like isoleucine patch superfamily enzyme